MKIVGISVKNILINNIKDLYESAFPSDERREFGEFKQIMTENEHFHVYAFLEDNHFAGFITFWEWDEFCYGEHFAVCLKCETVEKEAYTCKKLQRN